MPRLPDVTDYGARPSLRSNRVDPVHPEGLEVAEAVTRAAQVFANIYAEKQQKDSRVNYARAKNEIMTLDLQTRQSLKERQDYEAFDESYTTTFTDGANEIISRHGARLTPEDLALFQSEIDLIRERGRVNVADFAKGIEVELGRAEAVEYLQTAREEIGLADSMDDRNERIEQALENMKAAQDAGYYTPLEADGLLQEFTTAVAGDLLSGMEPEQRLAELEYALAWRERNGPLTAEKAAAGEGSNSIGDYLPKHELERLIRETEDQIEIDEVQSIGQSVSDAAWLAYPELEDVRARDAFVRDHPDLKDNPAARKEAQSLNAARREREGVAISLERQEISRQLTNGIYVTDGMGQLSSERMAKLTRTEQEQIRRLQSQVREGREWADATDWGAYSAWEQMSAQEQAEWDENGFWTDDQGNNIPWKTSVDVERARVMRAQSGDQERAVSSDRPYTGLNQEQQLERALVASPFFDRKPTAADSADDRARWMRISAEFNNRLLELNAEGVAITGEVRDKVLSNIVNTVVRTEKGRNRDMIAAGVSADLMAETYIPLDREVPMGGRRVTIYNNAVIPERVGGDGTNQQSVYVFIRNQLQSVQGTEPSQRDIEEVWYYVVTQGWDAAKARWLGTEGY